MVDSHSFFFYISKAGLLPSWETRQIIVLLARLQAAPVCIMSVTHCSDMYICTAFPCGRMVTVTGCCYATCELLNHLIHVHVQL